MRNNWLYWFSWGKRSLLPIIGKEGETMSACYTPIGTLNDDVIYVHGTDEPTFSVEVSYADTHDVQAAISKTGKPLALRMRDRGVSWDTRKDINSQQVNAATNPPRRM
jgi:hypothetical protein